MGLSAGWSIGGDEQRLDWDASGDLTRTTEANGTSYVYGADGSRVLRRDAKATTVYLPGMELRLAKGVTAAEAGPVREAASAGVGRGAECGP
ncbi:hypothetical protein ACFXPV_12900 [Streptomyces sp. NPDC059118]|uniref:hypothetical protein n=1 Tax=unclassified Streptomyces TaxID=2593676 RepID=UPI0036CAD94B